MSATESRVRRYADAHKPGSSLFLSSSGEIRESTPVAVRQEGVTRAAIDFMRDMLSRGVVPQGFTPDMITSWRKTGGPVAQIARYMMARPQDAALILSIMRQLAAAAREQEPMDVRDAMLAEQQWDGTEDVDSTAALIEDTPAAWRKAATTARRNIAKLDDFALAADARADALTQD